MILSCSTLLSLFSSFYFYILFVFISCPLIDFLQTPQDQIDEQNLLRWWHQIGKLDDVSETAMDGTATCQGHDLLTGNLTILL